MVRSPALVEHIVLPHLWRRYLSCLRFLVGGACLWLLLRLPHSSPTTLVVIAGVVTAYSALGVFWRIPDRLDRWGFLNHVLDLVFLLLSVALGGPAGFWVSALAAFSLFLALATLHDWQDVLVALVISVACTHFMKPPFARNLFPVVLLLGMFGCILALQKRTLLERLSNSLRQVLHYRSAARTAAITERDRIAADFHDGPLQSFISFQMRLEVARRLYERDPQLGMSELRALQEICQRQVLEIRTFVRNMRAPDVDGAGMANALRREVSRFEEDTGIATTFLADVEASHDDVEANIDIVQIIREALHNVQKHSRASKVVVSLVRNNGSLLLQVADDGRGFPWNGSYNLAQLEHMAAGPESIIRRVRILRGELVVSSRPGKGAELAIRVPGP